MAPYLTPLSAAFGSIYMVALLNAPLPSSPFRTPLFSNVKRKSPIVSNANNPKQTTVSVPRPPETPPTNEQYNKQMNTVFQYRRTTPGAAQQPPTSIKHHDRTMNTVFQYRTVISSPQSRRNVEMSETSSSSNGDTTDSNSETIDILDSTDMERNEETTPMDADIPTDDGEGSSPPVSQKVLDIVTETTKPLISPEIQHNVNRNLIQGAAIAGASLALLATKTMVTVPVASLASAYVSIHPGRAGDAARAVGKLAHTAGVLALNSTKSMGQLFVSARGARETASAVEEDEEIKNVLREVEEAEMMVDELKKVKERQEQQAVVDMEDVELEEVTLVEDEMEHDMEVADIDIMTMDWTTMTVRELKVELKERGLKVSGRKAELIQRLEEYAP